VFPSYKEVIKMKKLLVLLFMQGLLLIQVFGEDLIEYDYEVDLYYTNVSAYIDLDRDKEITDGSEFEEEKLYKHLFLNSFSPNIFLVEFAIHPMNYVGIEYRKRNEDLYTPQKRQDFNIVKTMTASFEEPYSVSFFLGRMMVFKKKNTDRVGNNRAYMGYLFTIGSQSIKDNRAYNDKWLAFEIKLKGTRDKQSSDLDWSFRLGTRLHEKVEFVDTFYVGARRKRIDYNKSMFSFINNTAYSATLSVSASTFELTEAEVIIDKFYPTGYDSLTLGFGVGYMYTSDNKYLGFLRDETVDNHQIIFRPNFKYKF